MDVKICDRCGKVCAVEDATHSRLGVDYYFDLCMDCRLWLLHELGKKEKWEEKEMKIKFSHNYYKLHNQTKAQLISVKRIVIDKDTNKGV